MEDKTKKTVAGLTAGAIGVAGAGIVAGNIISDKQEKEISESSIVAEDNSNNDEKVKSAITELTGVSTTTSDNTRTSYTTSTTTIELGNYGMSLEEYRSSKAAASTSTTSENVGNTSNSTETTVKEDISKTDTTTTTKDSVSDVDIDCYELMKDAIGYSLGRFDTEYSSLSDALVSTYGVELSDAQKARYDTVAKDTYEAYKKAIAAYESGDMESFRKICNDVLNSKKYLNLDDLIDILSININSQDHIINNSSNYSISKGKLVIDGANVESLFDVPNYVDHFDVMSYLSMYDGASEDDLRVLNIMQVPIYVANEAVSPTSFSLMVNGTLYAYRNEELNKRFNDINNYFVENIGLTDFGYEKTDSDVMYYGFDDNSQKQYISNDSEYIRDLSRYLMSFYPSYEKSKDGRVGYFDGQMMREYLNEFNKNLQKGATK